MKLRDAVEQHITLRQAMGEKCETNARVLRAFVRSIGVTADIEAARPAQVERFLVGKGPLTHSWFARHDSLVGFYRFATTRGLVDTSPLPDVLPKRPPPFEPYIYSTDELARLIKAAGTYQRNRSVVEPVSIRTVLLTLYGTATRIGEVLSLKARDVDLDNSVLTVREAKFYKSRLVPFGPRLNAVLASYFTRPRKAGVEVQLDTGTFFTNRNGQALQIASLEDIFRRVCEHAGVRRTDGNPQQPRLHDIRHTAAVHRLVAWYRNGRDVNRLLPHLSTYLGHTNLASTQVYLRMTPELLQHASDRFEAFAGWDNE